MGPTGLVSKAHQPAQHERPTPWIWAAYRCCAMLLARHASLLKQLPFAIRAAVLACGRRPCLRLAFGLSDNGKCPATPVTILLCIQWRYRTRHMNEISGAVVVPVKRLAGQSRSRSTIELLQIALFHITDRGVHQKAEVRSTRAW